MGVVSNGKQNKISVWNFKSQNLELVSLEWRMGMVQNLQHNGIKQEQKIQSGFLIDRIFLEQCAIKDRISKINIDNRLCHFVDS